MLVFPQPILIYQNLTTIPFKHWNLIERYFMKHPNLLNCVIAIWGLVPPNARDQSLSSSLKLPRPLKVTVQGQGLSFSTNKTARHHPAPSGHHRDSFKGILREGGWGPDSGHQPHPGATRLAKLHQHQSLPREESPALGTSQPNTFLQHQTF